MKLRIFLLVLFSVAVSYFATEYLFIGKIRDQNRAVARSLVSKASSLYKYIYRADSLYEIRAAEDLAKKQELMDAFRHRNWEEAIADNETKVGSVKGEKADVIKDIAMKVQVELNVINRMYDKNDAIFVIDTFGNVVAKNLDGLFGHSNLSDKVLFSAALKGVSNIDIVTVAGKTYRVVATPMYINGEIAGAYCSGDLLNSESANEVAANLNEDAVPVIEGGVLYFGFFDKSNLIGTTLPTDTHEGLRKFVSQNKKLFEQIDRDELQRYDLDINIKNENFYASISKHPTLSEDNDVFYITMVSADKIFAPIKAAHRNMIIVALVLLLIGLIVTIVIDEYYNRPVNRFMENMLEVINGNLRYRFDNDAEGVEGSLNQNANMMIAALLGEKVPENDLNEQKTNREE